MSSAEWEAKLDQLCDDFESSKRKGESPRIETFLSETSGLRAKRLFRELLFIDLEYAQELDEPIKLEEYVTRFPKYARVILKVFESLGERTSSSIIGNEESLPDDEISCCSKFGQFEFHAQGGLGQVFRAHDKHLKRSVAVKLIRNDMKDNYEASARFRLEAEVTSRLDHPGIVPVYAMGSTEAGRPYYVMRFIEGKDLRAAIKEYHEEKEELSTSECKMRLHGLLRHLASACRTVAYAHNRGVLHRDIKPENIMLGRFGETLVVDWGLVHFVERGELAKASGEKTLMPNAMHDSNLSSNSAAGTIGYLSPEQTPNSGNTPEPASDTYSLGATLYRILTGEAPFHPQQGSAVWKKIQTGDFPTPRRIDPSCPQDLDAICLKAMEVMPENRYRSPLDLADDLERWIADEPVSVRRPSRLETAYRIGRRHRGGTIVASASVLALFIVGVIFLVALGNKAKTESELRAEIQITQRETLVVASTFMADTLGREIDKRWQGLYDALEIPDDSGIPLEELILAADGKPFESPERQALQDWIYHRAAPWLSTNPMLAESWFITNEKGLQLARYPRADSIDQSYFHRSYFQSNDYDVDKDNHTAEDVEVIQRETLSMPYICTVDHTMKVVMTIPIRASSDKRVIAVIGMGADVGEQFNLFAGIETPCIVINLRDDSLEGEDNLNRGAIVMHPKMPKRITTCQRVDPSVLEELGDAPLQLLEHFHDPCDPAINGMACQAVIARIRVAKRDNTGQVLWTEPLVDSGLAVIVPNKRFIPVEE